MDCKKGAHRGKGDLHVRWTSAQNGVAYCGKSVREAREGIIGSMHSARSRVGVLVETTAKRTLVARTIRSRLAMRSPGGRHGSQADLEAGSRCRGRENRREHKARATERFDERQRDGRRVHSQGAKVVCWWKWARAGKQVVTDDSKQLVRDSAANRRGASLAFRASRLDRL